MKLDFRIPLFILAVTIPASVLTAEAVSNPPPGSLASVESFSSIGDQEARSAAYFTELGKVLTSPRCLNCHPAGDRPRQGDMARLHQPPVERGADGFGLPALRCPICHQAANFGGVPGNPIWHLAPHEMAWEGKTLSRFALRSRTPRRMAAARWRRSWNTSARIIWSGGRGRPVPAGNPRPARRKRRARSLRRGCRPGRHARSHKI